MSYVIRTVRIFELIRGEGIVVPQMHTEEKVLECVDEWELDVEFVLFVVAVVVGLDLGEDLLFEAVEVLFLQELFAEPATVAVVNFLARIILLEKLFLFLGLGLRARDISLDKDLFQQHGLELGVGVQFGVLDAVDLKNTHEAGFPVDKQVPK